MLDEFATVNGEGQKNVNNTNNGTASAPPHINEAKGKKKNVNFVAVYIQEAHAQDEWPISSARFTNDGVPVCVPQPKSIEERVAVAKLFQSKYNFRLPMLVDTMSNDFDAVFAPWPLRFYILQRGVLVYKSQPHKCSYDVAELRNRILSLV